MQYDVTFFFQEESLIVGSEGRLRN